MGSIAGAAVWVIAAIFGGGALGIWWAQMICWLLGVSIDPPAGVMAGFMGASVAGVAAVVVCCTRMDERDE
jgi:hypothetical protein